MSLPKVIAWQYSFVVRLPTAKVGKFCKLVWELKFARFASWLARLNM